MEKIVLLDIEGCVLPNKGGLMGDLSQLLSLQAMCKDRAVGLCTGRSQPFVEAVSKIIHAVGVPSIVENGCFLYDAIADILIPHPDLGDLGKFLEVKKFCVDRFVNFGLARLEPGKEVCVSLNPVICEGKMLPIQELKALVDQALPEKIKKFVFVTHSGSAVDITPKGIDKGAGIRFFAERMGVGLHQCIVVGDSSGDIPALQLAGYPACPANATSAVKELVRSHHNGYVARDEQTEGTIEILRHYFIV